MQRFSYRLFVALLTFAIGVIAATVELKTPRGNQRGVSAMKDLQIDKTESVKTEKFSLVGGMSVMTDRGCINSESYRAADGSQVTISQQGHSSSAHAVKEMRRNLKYAEQIVERTFVTNKKGEVGRRVVILRKHDPKTWVRASVSWTEGNRSYSINGESLEHVLELEKQYRERISGF